MKVVVIGAGGLAGSAIVRVFSQLGRECIPVTRSDYAERIGCEADVIINANGNSAKYLAEKDPAGEIERSVTSVLRSTDDFHAPLYIHLSSADVYPRQDDPSSNGEESTIDVSQLSTYGLCKYMAECVVRNRCPKWIILRLGGLLGPGLRKNPLYDLLAGRSLFVHPDSSFGYIHVDEVARIADHLINSTLRNDSFNVCGEGLIQVRDLMAWTGRTDATCESVRDPIRYEINNEKLRGFWEPPTSADTARDFIEWWRANNAPQGGA